MSTKTTLSLGKLLDVSQAEALYKKMAASLDKASVIQLNADKVERADVAGLQLVLALSNEAQTRGGKILWHKPSTVLTDMATSLGLHQALGLSL